MCIVICYYSAGCALQRASMKGSHHVGAALTGSVSEGPNFAVVQTIHAKSGNNRRISALSCSASDHAQPGCWGEGCILIAEELGDYLSNIMFLSQL